MPEAGKFSKQFREEFRDLLRWRRDVRRFKSEDLPPGLLEEILSLTNLAPSVGLSEPWRFVRVSDAHSRAAVRASFQTENERALSGYFGEQANQYARLKLAGLDSAPVHLAVFSDGGTQKGHGLGCQSMPEMRNYSVAAAVTTLWLAARAYGVGMGWVSILNPDSVHAVLSVPEEWQLVAYLCIGYPEQESAMPELERAGWESRAGQITLLER